MKLEAERPKYEDPAAIAFVKGIVVSRLRAIRAAITQQAVSAEMVGGIRKGLMDFFCELQMYEGAGVRPCDVDVVVWCRKNEDVVHICVMSSNEARETRKMLGEFGRWVA